MPRLHIALHDGFRGDRVVIAVDGRVVFDRPGVKTDLRISRADAVNADTVGQRAVVAVTVEPGQAQEPPAQGSVKVDVSATPFLGVDRRPDGGLSFKPASETFAYL
jgi:hypothetical protein